VNAAPVAANALLFVSVNVSVDGVSCGTLAGANAFDTPGAAPTATVTGSVAVSSSTAGSYGNKLAAGGLTTSNTPPSASAATATLNVVAAASTVPALDARMLALLAIALAGAAFFAMRR